MLSAAHLRFGPCAASQNEFVAFAFASVLITVVAVVVSAMEETILVNFHLHFVHTHIHRYIEVPSVSLCRWHFAAVIAQKLIFLYSFLFYFFKFYFSLFLLLLLYSACMALQGEMC